jgi:hypothetical protein
VPVITNLKITVYLDSIYPIGHNANKKIPHAARRCGIYYHIGIAI